MRIDIDSIVAAQIQAWRDALIDLSKRNPLLSLPKTVLPLATTIGRVIFAAR